MPRLQTPTGSAIGFAEAGAGERLPIVFLHGVGSDKSVWRPQLAHFGSERRAIAFDYPGYGDSDPAPEGTMRDDYAAAILSAMRALGVERAHVCGLSLGGVIAIAMNAAAPDSCVSLVLADSFADHPEGQAIYERSLAAADTGSLRPMAEARVDVLLAQPADPAVRAEVVETMAAIDPAAYRVGAEAVWLADQRERAAAIRVPTLVLCGAEDRVTPPALSSSLARLIPGAQNELIERAGHLTNLERADAFNTVVGAFVRGVDSRA
ncbi:MAG TPA: alpha/beta fold hydrolase [Sphingomicrobium sp.]|nr:alpha/beta fold hydrolase [Sphingomicrobium sp.]